MDTTTSEAARLQVPLRVWRAIARLNVGGPARHVVILNDGLQQRGMSTLLVHGSLTAAEASLEDSARREGLTLEYVEPLGRRVSLIADLRAFARLLRSIFRFEPDVVHTHTAKAGALGRAAATVFNLTRRRSRRCVVIHTFHGHVFTGYFGRAGSRCVQGAERLLARLADAVVVISERQRADIVERFRIAPAHKVSVVPLGLRLEPLLTLPHGAPSLREELGIPAGAVVFGFVGRFAQIKDVPVLIEAFHRMAVAHPDAHLVLIGDGETRPAAEAQARRGPAGARVHFPGWRMDLRSVYATIDVGVLTSRNEGTPVALIEGMAAGRPVIATDVGGVPDVVEHERSGLLIPAGDAQACAAAMSRLAGDPALRDVLGGQARERARRFDHARLTREVVDLYTQLLARRRD